MNENNFDIGRTSFNVDNVRAMKKDEFVKQYSHLRLPPGMTHEALYDKIAKREQTREKPKK